MKDLSFVDRHPGDVLQVLSASKSFKKLFQADDDSEWEDVAYRPRATVNYAMLDADIGYCRQTNFVVDDTVRARDEVRMSRYAEEVVPGGMTCSARLGKVATAF